MEDVIAGMTGPQLTGFVAVVGAFVSGTVIAVAGVVLPLMYAARKASGLNQLKRDLAAAGYKPDEVERVVKAMPNGFAPEVRFDPEVAGTKPNPRPVVPRP